MQLLQKADIHKQVEISKAEMAESEGIKEKVNQVAIQAAMAVMMAFRETDTGSQTVIIPNHGPIGNTS